MAKKVKVKGTIQYPTAAIYGIVFKRVALQEGYDCPFPPRPRATPRLVGSNPLNSSLYPDESVIFEHLHFYQQNSRAKIG